MARGESNTEEQIAALDSGGAFVDFSFLRKALVRGPDAEGWLNDLVTAVVESMHEGESTRSLLLSPTGRIRADFHVVRTDEAFVLLQDSAQPENVEHVLEPYVLSSDVELVEQTDALAVFALGKTTGVPDPVWTGKPSILGKGIDVAVAASRHDETEKLLAGSLVAASREALEIRRIRKGIPSFPHDTGNNALPAEAGLESLIDFTKGCFLGQESVAKVRNLGHPPNVVVALRTAGPVTIGDPVFSDDEEAGVITSVTPGERGTLAIARIGWGARDGSLAT